MRAGALLYAIAVSLIIALLCSALIFYSLLSSLSYQANIIRSNLLFNSNSGIHILMSKDSIVPLNKKIILDLFGDGTDSVILERKDWGGFEVYSSTATFKNDSSGKKALIGYDFFEGNQTTLYLCDLGRPLSLCGKTVIKGTCFLPKAGVKRAYIEGQNFVGDKLIDGELKASSAALPPVNEGLLNRLKEIIAHGARENDSIINYENAEIPDTMSNSFSHNTLFVYSEGTMLVENKNLSGNILLYSKKNITVGSGSDLHDLLLIAPSIVIDENFKGNLQAFATDSIVIKSKCELKYPSVLGIVQEKNSGTASFIRMEHESEFTGIIFAYQENFSSQTSVNVSIQKNAVVSGQLYSSGTVDIQGSVFGSVFCSKTMLRTPYSIYENHLLNATIDYSKLSIHFTGISLIEQSENKKIVKWLY